MSNFKRKTTNGYESIPINADMLGGMTLEQIKAFVSGKVDSIPQATSSKFGGIKIGYSENGKNYPVELNSDGQAYVNVPWVSSGYTLPDATSDTKGGVKAYFGAKKIGSGNWELWADIQQSNNTLYIRAGQFQQTSGSGSTTSNFTFKRAMNTMGGSASYVAVILGDSYGQSTSGGYMGSLAVDSSNYSGFSYRASNGELGHVYYIVIGRW